MFCFTTRFCFVEQTIRMIPILTRPSRASSFPEVFARLSKNHTGVNCALKLSRHDEGSEGVAAFSVGFCSRSFFSCPKLHWSPCGEWLFFSTGRFFTIQKHKGSQYTWSQFSHILAGDAIEVNVNKATWLAHASGKKIEIYDSGLHHFDRAHDVSERTCHGREKNKRWSTK